MANKLPDVYTTNLAFAHSPSTNHQAFLASLRQSPAVTFWTGSSNSTAHVTRRIYQTARDLQGKRNAGDGWSANNFRELNHVIRGVFVEQLQFLELDEWLLTAGKVLIDDGWHFGGGAKLMEAMIYINMLCNQDDDKLQLL